MKNIYSIVGIIGIIIVGVIAYFIGVQDSQSSLSFLKGSDSSIMQYVPDELGQVLVLKPDEDLIQVAKQTNSFDVEAFGTILESLEMIVVYQNAQQDQPVSLLFMQGDETFDISQVETLGLLAGGEGYEARELGDDRVVYADALSLDWYDSQDGSLSDVAAAQPFLRQISTDNYNAGFFSTPTGVSQLGGYSALLADSLESTYLLSSLSVDQLQGQLIIQMQEGFVPQGQGTFEASLSPYTQDALFALELQGLQDLLGIEPQRLQSLLPFLAGSAGIALPSPDGITNLLQDTLALVVTPSAISPLGLQASLLIDGDHFQTLSTLYPTLQELITSNLPLIASGSVLDTQQLPDQLITILPAGEENISIMSLSVSDNVTQLVVFGEPVVANAGVGEVRIDDASTIGLFSRESSIINQIIGEVLPTEGAGGRLQGSIHAQSQTDQIRIEFVQTPSDA